MEILIAHFLGQASGLPLDAVAQVNSIISEELLDVLKIHRWTGNLTELRTVANNLWIARTDVERSIRELKCSWQEEQTADTSPEDKASWSRGEREEPRNQPSVSKWDVTQFVQENWSTTIGDLYVRATEKLNTLLIQEVLSRTVGNQAKAALILGMTRTSLRRKIQASKLNPLEFNSNQEIRRTK